VNDDDKRALLVRLAAGDIGRGDAEVAAAAAGDAAFATAVDELLAVRARLDHAAGVERDLLSPPVSPAGPPAAGRPDVVGDTMRRLAATKPAVPIAPAPSRRRWPWIAAAVAAAAATVVFMLCRGGGASSDDDRTLGADKLMLLPPKGTLRTGLDFSWRCSVSGASFRAEIYDPTAPASRKLPARDEGPETEWHLDADSLKDVLPQHRWRVVARIGGGEIVQEGALPR
jgi:hypothetical protein